MIAVDSATLADPGPVVAALHEAWARRQPVVVSLGVDADEFRSPASITEDPWRLGARFEVWLDRLHFLVWANTYDARGGIEPIWWWGRKALRLRRRSRRRRSRRHPAARRPAGVGRRRARGPLDGDFLGGVVLVHRESVEADSLQAGAGGDRRR